jgi:hypothetical protein
MENRTVYYPNAQDADKVLKALRGLGEVFARIVHYPRGYAIQRYSSGTYWAGLGWDNGAPVMGFSDWEQAHGYPAALLKNKLN